jgi:hypothetical protein
MKQDLKEVILNKVSEIQIFEHYLGTPVKLGRAIVSPLRQEKHPSFNVYQSKTNGRIYYKDFGDERGDCFKFVMQLHRCSFYEAIQLIAQDFGIDLKNKNDLSKIRRQAKKIRIPQIFVTPRKKLPYARLNWSDKLMELWRAGNVRLEVLQEYNTWAVDKIKIKKRDDDGHFILMSKPGDPIYCFDYENGVKKFYRPNAPNKKYKFISNLRKGDIFGLKQLQEHVKKHGRVEILVLCAGQKDCLSLYSNTGIRGIALNSESASVSKELYIELSTLAKSIVVVYDNDETGKHHAAKIKEEVGIDYVDLGDLAPAEIVNDVFDYFKEGFSADDLINLIKRKC